MKVRQLGYSRAELLQCERILYSIAFFSPLLSPPGAHGLISNIPVLLGALGADLRAHKTTTRGHHLKTFAQSVFLNGKIVKTVERRTFYCVNQICIIPANQDFQLQQYGFVGLE